MTDRSLRFAARMIAVGLLGVAWTIGTLVLVIARESDTVLGLTGLLPVTVMLVYVILTDLADWRISRKERQAQAAEEKD